MQDNRVSKPFFQTGPQLYNQFTDDETLRLYLNWRLPPEVRSIIIPGLTELGERVVTDITALATAAEAHPPELIHYDPWGRRIDAIQVAPAWQALHAVAATEGIVATAYERQQSIWSRLHQFVRLYLFHPSSAMVSCPLAMTDGAARVLEQYADDDLKRRAFTRLRSRDPELFWTSGQWMTERTGGSDVSATSTQARLVEGEYRLYGTKWFTSATTSQMALALTKTEDTDALSLYYLETRDEKGLLNGIEIRRLKDKLGTRAMPTAELSLQGTPARLIGKQGEGVKTVATMLNITRLYNAVCAVAYMRRGIALAYDYAKRRYAFGKPLLDQPLHGHTLENLQLQFQGAFHLVFHLGLLLGKDELKQASSAEQALLRLLTPVAKLYTGKQAVAVCSEVLECFGGAGYIEDTGLPRLLRDAQVLPIWEGTTNVLSLDVLRVLKKPEVFEVFVADVRARLGGLSDGFLPETVARVDQRLAQLVVYARNAKEADIYSQQAGARRFAFALAQIYIAGLLLEHAHWGCQQLDASVAQRLVKMAKHWSVYEMGMVDLLETKVK